MYAVDLLVAGLALLLERARAGTTTVISCMMMLAVMYGMMPSPNSERFASAPPENRLSTLRIVLLPEPKKFLSASVCTPGTGRYEPAR